MKKQRTALLRGRELARGAADKTNARPSFERRQALAHHGERHAELARRGGQAAEREDAMEGSKLVEVVQHSQP